MLGAREPAGLRATRDGSTPAATKRHARAEQRVRFGDGEQAIELVREPGGRALPQGLCELRPRTGGNLAQDRVPEAGDTTTARALDLADCFVDRGPGRHAIEQEQLVGGD